MALYIPHSIFHLAWLLYVRPETFGPYYLGYTTAHTLFFHYKYQLVIAVEGKYRVFLESPF